MTTTSPTIIRRLSRLPWPAVLLVTLIVIIAVGGFVFPTYTSYDATYSLIWGRQLLHGQLPDFAAYRAPTQHPLGLVFGAFFALFGRGGDRLMVLATLISFIVLVAGLYRLGRTTFTTLVGVAAGVVLCTRFDFPFLAARGYIDIPYLALVIWAAALEAARPRRGFPVLWLLALAGLLRPEAWILSGIYWLWLFPALGWRQRLQSALLVASAPLIWAGIDYAVTGDPLFSQNHTSGLAEELGRQKGIGQVPSAMLDFVNQLVKLPLAVAGLVGVVLSCWLVPRRVRVPLWLLVIGLATFLLVGLGGFSVINRYLLVPSLMLMLFASFAVAGFTVLHPGRLRDGWMVLAGVAVLLLVAWTALRVDVGRLVAELRFRGDSEQALVELLDRPAVRRAALCGPVLTSNHRLVPSVRWIMNLPADRVTARSDVAAAAKVDRGLIVLAADRAVLLRDGLDPGKVSADDALRNLPLPGYQPLAANELYSVYGRCR